jgi:hypothetical protein
VSLNIHSYNLPEIRMDISGVDRQSVDEAIREAEAKPLAFAPGARANYVRDMIRDLSALVNAGRSAEEIKAVPALGKFAQDYPELFKKVLQRQDLSHLGVMLNALDKMETGALSQHQASILVGQRLVDKIVKPQLSGNGKNT